MMRLDEGLKQQLAKYMTEYIVENLKKHESKIISERHDRQKESLKELIRRYRKYTRIADAMIDNAIRAESEIDHRDILDMMSCSGREFARLEGIKENAARIKVAVSYLDNVLKTYQKYCEISDNDEEKRRYRVLYKLYIADEKKTADEVAECENIDRSTVYRDIDNAVEDLAIHFFGAYGLNYL